MVCYASPSSGPSAHLHVSYISHVHSKEVNNSTGAYFSTDHYSSADDRIAILKAGDRKRFFRSREKQSPCDSEAQLGPDTNASDTIVEATTVYDEMSSNDLIFAINSQASDDSRMCVLQGHITFRSQEYSARILLDSGADRQYMSATFVRKAGQEIDTSRNHATAGEGREWAI